ncbi:hypothetical protein ACRRTK_012576 [Alexandromys fortis]
MLKTGSCSLFKKCLFNFILCAIGMKVSDSLELELQTVVSCHVGAWELNLGPLGEQSVLLTTEPSLQIPSYGLELLILLPPTCVESHQVFGLTVAYLSTGLQGISVPLAVSHKPDTSPPLSGRDPS